MPKGPNSKAYAEAATKAFDGMKSLNEAMLNGPGAWDATLDDVKNMQTIAAQIEELTKLVKTQSKESLQAEKVE